MYGYGRGGLAGGMAAPAEGSLTALIYGALREEKYSDAIATLLLQLQAFPRSRAALSLLGYAFFMAGDYRSSASAYEELLRYYPEVEQYKLYYAQALFKAGEWCGNGACVSSGPSAYP